MGRSTAEPLKFFEKVKHVYSDKPTTYTDRAPLYGQPIRVMGLKRGEGLSAGRTLQEECSVSWRRGWGDSIHITQYLELKTSRNNRSMDNVKLRTPVD